MKRNKNTTSILVGGPGVSILGDIESTVDIVVECSVRGDITSAASVSTDNGAVINGDITAKEISIAASTVNGNLTAEVILLDSSCKITGDIIAKSLIVEAGAVINGKCEVSNNTSSPNVTV